MEDNIPNPLRTDLIIENPLHGREESMAEELKALPEAERQAYIAENFNHLFKKVKVVKVGNRVTEISGVEAGMLIMTSPGALSQGIFVNDEKHVIIRDRDVLASW